MEKDLNYLQIAKKEMKNEADAILEASKQLDENFNKTIDVILACKGKIVVSGMGKMGIIAKKIAATLASTGTTAIFLHAAEGNHGDLGMINKSDVIVILSYSGQTSEILSMIPYLKFIGVKIIAITGNRDSQLAKQSDIVLSCRVKKEYEPFGIVPTASTTVALSIGNAIAITLLKLKNFNAEDFAKFHPGGAIGKKLLLKVRDLMHSGEKNPVLSEDAKMDKVILEMTSKGLGCTSFINKEKILTGIITDGDLRRIISKDSDFLKKEAKEFMTKNPKFVLGEDLAVKALNIMEEYKITMLPVVDSESRPIGMIHMHDLITAGII